MFNPSNLPKIIGEEKARDLINSWAPLLFKCGWRGRGGGKNIHETPLSSEDFKRFSKEFEYKPVKNTKDFTTGSEAEQKALQRFLSLLDLIIRDINIELLTR